MLDSYCFLHVLLHLLFCVCKHFSKAFTLSTQVPKFKSAKQLYRVNSSVVRPLQGLVSTKISPLPLEVPNLKFHCVYPRLSQSSCPTFISLNISSGFHMTLWPSIMFPGKLFLLTGQESFTLRLSAVLLTGRKLTSFEL